MYRLHEVRRRRGLTRVEMASLMGVSQSRISVIERRSISVIEVGTLIAYIEAMGGTLRLTAEFDGVTLPLEVEVDRPG